MARGVLLRLARLALLLGAAAVAWRADAGRQAAAPRERASLDDARLFFPRAARLAPRADDSTRLEVWSAEGRRLGTLLTTSPLADDLIGYSGASNVLVALDDAGRVAGLRLLASGDTPAHVNDTRRAAAFWRQFVGWAPADGPLPRVDAVSGSTLTSLAIAEGVERRLTGAARSRRFAREPTLHEARAFFPTAAALRVDDPRPGWRRVVDAQGATLGHAVLSSPAADNVRGYRGPSEALVVLAPDQNKLLAVRLRATYDTPDYAERVRDDADFLALLARPSARDWPTLDFARAGVEGVSGATQTSYALAAGLRRRFEVEARRQEQSAADWRRRARDLALGLFVCGALATAYTPLRGARRWRLVWQAALVVGFGLCLGDLLSLALFVGWARGGAPWSAAPCLVALAAVALLAPWATRRNVYCQHACPHGAAQEWLGRARGPLLSLVGGSADASSSPPPSSPPPASRGRAFDWRGWLARVPLLTLATAFALALTTRFNLAWLEPFDAWLWTGFWSASGVVAVVGLAASLFVPQAYCRFGCPTGALLKLMQTGGARDRLSRREGWAAALVLAGAAWVWWPGAPREAAAPANRLAGGDPGAANDPGASNDPGAANDPGVWSDPGASDPSAASGLSEPPQISVAGEPALAGEAFGVSWAIHLRRGAPPGDALRAKVAAELERVEQLLSARAADSATAQFNASETTFALEQPAELVALVALARDVAEATDGAFDITSAPLVDAWNAFERSNIHPPSGAELAALLDRVGWRKLGLDPEAGTLQKEHPELRVDLDDLLAGHAADRLAALLDAEFEAAPPEGRPRAFLARVGSVCVARGAWPVNVHTRAVAERTLARLTLVDGALAAGALAPDAASVVSPRGGRLVETPARVCAARASSGAAASAWREGLRRLEFDEAKRVADERGLTLWHVGQDGVARNNLPE